MTRTAIHGRWGNHLPLCRHQRVADAAQHGPLCAAITAAKREGGCHSLGDRTEPLHRLRPSLLLLGQNADPHRLGLHGLDLVALGDERKLGRVVHLEHQGMIHPFTVMVCCPLSTAMTSP